MSWHFSQGLVLQYNCRRDETGERKGWTVCVNLPSLRGLEEAYLGEFSLDGKLFAPWKSTPIAQDDSCSDKMKGTCHRSPFGMMYVPLMGEGGEALLTWFPAVATEMTNAAGKIMTSVKLEHEYANLRKEKPKIPFMEYGRS